MRKLQPWVVLEWVWSCPRLMGEPRSKVTHGHNCDRGRESTCWGYCILGTVILKLECVYCGYVYMSLWPPSMEGDGTLPVRWHRGSHPNGMGSMTHWWPHPLPSSTSFLLRQKQMAAEQEKVGAEFQALRAFLVEQEGRLLGRLEELSREVTQKQNENLAQLGDEIAQLSKLSSQIQETTCRPDLDFLQVSLAWPGVWVINFKTGGLNVSLLLFKWGNSSENRISLVESHNLEPKGIEEKSPDFPGVSSLKGCD